MMNQHQRNILSLLDIDVWVTKQSSVQQMDRVFIWRDQVVPKVEQLSSEIKLSTSAKSTIEEKKSIQPSINNEAQISLNETLPHHSSDEAELETQQDHSMVVVKQTSEHVKHQAQSVEGNVEFFELQACVLAQCIILVDATQLSALEQQLWLNIQKSVLGQYAELKWPFPLHELQDHRGMQPYIQGFLEALSGQKHILCLGKSERLQHRQMIYLASLQEMIEQPTLKKRLWQLMRKEEI